MTEEEWDAVLQVHLYGAFNMVRNVVPHMIKQNYGRIVLFSSGSGLGASGQGNYAAAIPALSGQHSQYIEQQLKNFRSGTRSNDPNKMMRNIVHRMTDNEIKSVAEYIQGLY